MGAQVSYVRWSTPVDTPEGVRKSDVYIYGSSDGFALHIGNRRRKAGTDDPEAWEELPPLPDGVDRDMTLSYDAPEAVADVLELLQAAGYIVPQYVIDDFRKGDV